jgi:MerR family transcriptional regulator/heat shock protein HspR
MPDPMDDPSAAFYTVGQVSDLLGIQAAFLRRLDSEDLVQPARSEGGQRRYSREEIASVRRAVQLASEGLTLEGIRRVFLLEAEVADLNRRLDAAKADAKRKQPRPARKQDKRK